MEQDISLQALIEQVKNDLLSPSDGPGYPLFLVDKVELELTVSVQREGSGELNISVIQVGGKHTNETGHVIRVTMSPILTREEQIQLLRQDGRMWAGVQRAASSALRKTVTKLAGTPE